MNKSILVGIGFGIAIASGITAMASDGMRLFSTQPKYAEVISVTPVKETIKTPRQACQDVTVTHKKPVKDQHQIAGSILGAVAGGVLGHQFGGGHGKQLATIASAAAGGYTGHEVQGHLQNTDTYTTSEKRCKTVQDSSEKILGYDVAYKVGDKPGNIRMDHQPEKQIPLDDKGQLIVAVPVTQLK